MASTRKLAFTALKSSPVNDLTEGRIFEASAINKQKKRPLVGLRMHTEFPVGRRTGSRQYLQVWAYDTPGDYLRIDEILKHARDAIEAIPHQEDFLEAVWIETGVDLRDDAMEAITRYSRFQFTYARREAL